MFCLQFSSDARGGSAQSSHITGQARTHFLSPLTPTHHHHHHHHHHPLLYLHNVHYHIPQLVISENISHHYLPI